MSFHIRTSKRQIPCLLRSFSQTNRASPRRQGRLFSSQPLKSATSEDRIALQSILHHDSKHNNVVITDTEAIAKHNTDWTGHYSGHSKILLKPSTPSQISEILKYCNQHRVGIVPQGGNTGLVGGSVPLNDEIILSLERLNRTLDFDDTSGILTCESGCVLQDLHDFVSQKGFLMPIDLGSKGSCMIGGNVSTNAGGQYYYRYGSLHGNVLGMEAVLPNGDMLDMMNVNRKDNTGYDLKRLFIGSEGTLGVITKVVMSCPGLLRARNAVFLGCPSFEAVEQVLRLAKAELGEILAAFEFMDRGVLDIVARSKKRIPLEGTDCDFYLLVETQGSDGDHDRSKMEQFLTKIMEDGHVVDGVLAEDEKRILEMWEIRESCAPCISSMGYTYKYDVSIPISDFHPFAEEMKQHITTHKKNAISVNWGHVIDGNLHFNIVAPGESKVDQHFLDYIEPLIFKSVVRRGGSISAEHGMGQCKNKYMPMVADACRIQMMRNIKNMFDPVGIMNPGKVLPPLDNT